MNNNFTEHFVNASNSMHSNINNTSNTEVLNEILKNTIEIKQSVKEMNNRLEKLEADNLKLHTRQLTEIMLTQKLVQPRKDAPILKTPFNSVEEFQKFEESIRTSNELCEKLEDEIFHQHGADPSKFVRLIWRKIMTDRVASQYSWRRTHLKKSIDVMSVTNVLRGAFTRKVVGAAKEFNRGSAKWFQKKEKSKRLKIS